MADFTKKRLIYEYTTPPLSPDTQATRLAVSKTLERKRRLGQYSVQWNGKESFAIGDDAPDYLKITNQSDH